MKLIFDVYPLINSFYTGIPQTTWNLAKRFVLEGVDCLYTFGYRILEKNEFEALLAARSGKNVYESIVLHKALTKQRFLSKKDFMERIYFSPHVLSCTSGKNLGCARIVHDLTSLTMPQFHSEATIQTDSVNLARDVAISDVIFTVSHSSKQEIVKYLNVEEHKVVVSYPGVDWSDEQLKNSSKLLFDSPYVIILATREPRKNLDLVLKYIAHCKEHVLKNDLVYVFAGPEGWGQDTSEALKQDLEVLRKAGKLVSTGFIPEELKLSLLNGARYMIFPSFFEGFGSPVAEALSVGTPVVCSYGGSLPEVGGDAAYYFSPMSMESLQDAIVRMEVDLRKNSHLVKQKSWLQGSKFSWKTFSNIIIEHLEHVYLTKTA